MNLGKIKRFLKKENISKLCYLKFINKLDIDDKSILLESQHGNNLNGNIFYLLRELHNEDYNKYKLYLVVNKKNQKEFELIIKEYKLFKAILINNNSREYYKVLASAKYLFNDTSFNNKFIKKDGQVYFNTWHGTPLKTLGRSDKTDFHSLGNVQKNFLVADYLLYPSIYMMDHMLEDYMINNIGTGKVVLNGYPRNSVFLDIDRRKQLRDKLKFNGKQIIAYMPTWRGSLSSLDDDRYINETITILNQIDKRLTNDQVMYVNMHPFVRDKIDLSLYKNIKPFPDHLETYDFLNITDILITDYSSVFFDYVLRKNKIILFTYDEEEYFEDRGLYLSLEELPFPKVKTIDELIQELNNEKNYNEDEFIEKFCKYESIDANKKICEFLILNKKNDLKVLDIPNNQKENVLIYSGNLSRNGITSSLFSLLNNIDLEDKNYYLTVSTRNASIHSEILAKLPSKVNYILSDSGLKLTFNESVNYVLWREKIISFNKVINIFENMFKRENKRLYGNIRFNHVIQFGGYEFRKIMSFALFKGNRIIYVHSDMEQEIIKKGNQDKAVLTYAYNTYDKVAVVTKDIFYSTARIKGNDENIYVAHNLIDYRTILINAEKDLELDEYTEVNISYDKLLELLNNDNKKFITIGRFSVEKGHDRLIKSFNELYKSNNKINLIIIGGYGKLYDEILELVNSLECKDNIIIIKSISNPFPILKKCDYFVLSSLYEGFGLVLAEATVLGLPVISTDIDGPRLFMKKYGGHLVENSCEGILQGMKDCLNNKVSPLKVDFEEYNRKAIDEFYNLMK
ncbi:MAG: CDP-glycerol glycerophosphotransferase family protein [Bacilli bacterium]|nr:CDP-glycerol glycerophosphotransferase family protein [Bacilli bacterium]